MSVRRRGPPDTRERAEIEAVKRLMRAVPTPAPGATMPPPTGTTKITDPLWVRFKRWLRRPAG